MPITPDGLTRAKLTQTVPITVTIAAGTVVEVDTANEESFFLPLTIGTTDPAAFSVGGTVTTSGSNILTTTNNGFVNVAVGDAVSGAGIPANATVAAKTNDNAIELSANATASATITAAFDPPAITPTIFAIKLNVKSAGSAINITPEVHKYDGSLRGVAGTAVNSKEKTVLQSVSIDLDSFLTNCRVARIN